MQEKKKGSWTVQMRISGRDIIKVRRVSRSIVSACGYQTDNWSWDLRKKTMFTREVEWVDLTKKGAEQILAALAQFKSDFRVPRMKTLSYRT